MKRHDGSLIQKQLISLTERLVRFKSIDDRPQELKRVVEFCAGYFKTSNGLIVKKYQQNSKPSLVILTKNTKNPKIMLAGHLDVVPGAPEQFRPKLVGRKLYGRGALDMKAPVAAMMLVLKNLAKQKPRQTIGLLLDTDEEIGGLHGSDYLINQKGYRCDVAVVPDGGYDLQLIITQKGMLQFELGAEGQPSHGSRPWEGINAVDLVFKAYNRLKYKFPFPEDIRDWHPSISLNQIKGGTAVNVIPRQCEGRFDFRFTEHRTMKEWQRIIEAIAKKYGLQCKYSFKGQLFHTSKSNKYLQRYAQIQRKITGKKVVLTREHGASDARFFSTHNIPVVMSSPAGADTHGNKEWVDIRSLKTFYDITYQFVREVSNGEAQ